VFVTLNKLYKICVVALLFSCMILAGQNRVNQQLVSIASSNLKTSQSSTRAADYWQRQVSLDQEGSPPRIVTQESGGHPRSIPERDINLALLGFAVAAFMVWLACYLIIRFEHLHAHLSHDHVDSGPQKYHSQPTPRIGGLAIISGLAASGLALYFTDTGLSLDAFGLLLLAAIPAFGSGLVEDLTKHVSVMDRLILTMVSAAAAAWLLNAVLTRMEIPLLREALTWMPFAVVFTVFAVAGVANATNIIDGYNGLASGYSIIILVAIAWLSAQVSDSLMLVLALAMLGAMIGFVFWNWPRGRIFMGDSGAYLLGFWLAELCVLLVVRNPVHVPARLGLALMIYPVFETIFSIYRRKFLLKQSPGLPDNFHLHQLFYKYLVKELPDTADPAELTRRNSTVAPYFWAFTLIYVLLALHYGDGHPTGLAAVILIYCVCYIWGYFHLLNKTNACTKSQGISAEPQK
jgi:UDP-N-acetylmuramyl pentapeptide phosphotransferase/UDP-N-acetylglucosamine-1-phosphate transferase